MLPAVTDAARIHTMEVLEAWLGILRDPDAPAAARVTAGDKIMERGWGKAALPITGADENGALTPFAVNVLIRPGTPPKAG